VTILEIILEIISLVLNGGFQDFSENPWFGPSLLVLTEMGAKSVPLILTGQWWRFFTPIFLHAGAIHLLLNLGMQLKIGIGLERQFGALRVAPIYFACGIAGNLFSCLFSQNLVTVQI
jgi:membrane associated rhomboid family serine protease